MRETMSELPTVAEQNQLELTMDTMRGMKAELRLNPDVQRLAKSVDYRDQLSLHDLGKESAVGISKFADQMLAKISVSSQEDSGEMLRQLAILMDRFDKNDFTEEKKGLLAKVLSKNKTLDQIFNKYQTLGTEIDKIYVEVTKYQTEMKQSLLNLEQMYQENMKHYYELEKVIVAGELVLENLQTIVLPSYQARMNEGDQIAQFEVTTVLNAIELVERRLADLEAAKMVALQNAPQIRLLQKGNNNLIAKINSAFVVTIPVFKTGIIQAVNAKRQKLVADSMAELDRRTNELLLQNAQNIANQSVEITQLAGGTSIKLETLEKTWETIQRGIQETLELEKQNRQDRQASQQRLEQLSAKIHLSLNER